MSVAMKYDGRADGFDRLQQAGGTEEREDHFGFAQHGIDDGRVMEQYHSLLDRQAAQRIFELDGFIERDLHELLDLRLAEWRERAAAKPPAESLDAGKADAFNDD